MDAPQFINFLCYNKLVKNAFNTSSPPNIIAQLHYTVENWLFTLVITELTGCCEFIPYYW